MKFRYLNEESWAAVTREERFFCARLYELIRDDVPGFVAYLANNELCDVDLKQALLEPSAREIGYEVCFYRDLYKLKPNEVLDRFQYDEDKAPGESSRDAMVRLGLLKRTFDLCLFAENSIVIFEAKAQQGFSTNQMDLFQKDRRRVASLTGLNLSHVFLVTIASNTYTPHRTTTDRIAANMWLTWHELARHFNEDAILKRADAVHQGNK